MRSLVGKIALVTGGSRGLGRWICVALAKSGASVGVNYAYNEEDAAETVRIIEAAGGTAFPVRGDITKESSVKRVIATVNEKYDGTIDILVNNATGPQELYSLEELTWEHYVRHLEFFVKSPLLLTKALMSAMKEKGNGSIINIGSEVVQLGNPNFSDYVTAKSAMVGMTRSWANELGPHGIRVNLIAPGFIPVERTAGVPQDVIEAYKQDVPLMRMGEPMDIANAVVFLASNDSKFITGQCLAVNGGKTNGI